MEKLYCLNTPKFRSKKHLLEWYFTNKQPTTYYFADKSIQCGPQRNRSLNDLYILTKSYFKSATKTEVICILLGILKHHEDIEQPMYWF